LGREWSGVAGQLVPGRSEVRSAVPTGDGIRQDRVEVLYRVGGVARRELPILDDTLA
jgi:hypothetical protein